MRVITKDIIIKELTAIGLEKGDVVMVHTSLKSMGYVCGGAQAVIEALIEVVGENGTIMMPTQSWKILTRKKGFTGMQMNQTGNSFERTGRLMIKE